ncbi:PREDICTED: CDPK-related [Prunus dulcis]|uniref:PREDICTED: CDPK-related n=1 Tax=Prunus dulcis TaxID=3755 RepID=A0A5E4EHJ5_PRUDU|nr:CDPK-related protein kinase-like [Prunus dulcis]KAI5314461.1 hypothetical protein L3X38_043637 [Prunus dulcis]VVA15275.1 PREDICTED: CDPK-related [Prunus dulcis]
MKTDELRRWGNVAVFLKVYGLVVGMESLIASANTLQYRRMDFEEFCAAALSVHQLEALFIEELAPELRLGPSIPIPLHVVLHDWIWHTGGKITAGASLVTSLNAVFLIFCA